MILSTITREDHKVTAATSIKIRKSKIEVFIGYLIDYRDTTVIPVGIFIVLVLFYSVIRLYRKQSRKNRTMMAIKGISSSSSRSSRSGGVGEGGGGINRALTLNAHVPRHMLSAEGGVGYGYFNSGTGTGTGSSGKDGSKIDFDYSYIDKLRYKLSSLYSANRYYRKQMLLANDNSAMKLIHYLLKSPKNHMKFTDGDLMVDFIKHFQVENARLKKMLARFDGSEFRIFERIVLMDATYNDKTRSKYNDVGLDEFE